MKTLQCDEVAAQDSCSAEPSPLCDVLDGHFGREISNWKKGASIERSRVKVIEEGALWSGSEPEQYYSSRLCRS
jgi:hypothetical protein